MSDLIRTCQLSDSKDYPEVANKPVHQKIQMRQARLGDNLTIRRALPTRDRRMIGAWCFFDHFGPMNLKNGHELDIAPHPHIGLQTFTWILEGEILHRDSLGSEQFIKPGQVNLMTAGRGIAHSEESFEPHTELHGLQLWIALPDSIRHMEPNFKHYPELPVVQHEGLSIHMMVGELFNVKAPVAVHSPLIGLDIQSKTGANTTLPMNPKFEYGVLALTEDIEVEGIQVDKENLLYLGCGRSELPINIPKDARFVLIGGEPFEEEILLWWNFVARSKQEIMEVTDAWNQGRYFDEVKGYVGERFKAPVMP